MHPLSCLDVRFKVSRSSDLEKFTCPAGTDRIPDPVGSPILNSYSKFANFQYILRYASRVKLITNSASKNAESKEISRLKDVIAKLKKGGVAEEEAEEDT